MKPILTRIALEFCVVATFATTATGQFAPSSLAVPSAVSWSGTFLDSEEGLLSETKTVNITSPTNFVGSNSYGDSSTGTYTYTNTGSNTGRINYTATYTYDDGEGGQDTETEIGIADGSGFPGMEIGTYTWNTTTGAFASFPTVDQNGEWGLSHNVPGIKFFVNGDQLFIVEGEELFILYRPVASSSAVVGSWVIISDGRPAVIVFLADGTYRHSEAGAPVGVGFIGMEKGTYTWNPTTGALTAIATLDQNGDWGFPIR
jgi:hypothetical protein